MSVYIAKISLHVLDEDISENDIRLFEKIMTNVGSTSYLKLDKMQIKRVGDIIHIWMEKGSRIWVTNVSMLQSYVTKFKENRSTYLDIDMKIEKVQHECNMTEIVGSKFFFGRKENLIRLQQFIEDEENCYLKLDKICLIKVPEEDFLHVWICGAGDAGAIDNQVMMNHMEDFEKKLNNCDKGHGWMYESCCSKSKT